MNNSHKDNSGDTWTSIELLLGPILLFLMSFFSLSFLVLIKERNDKKDVFNNRIKHCFKALTPYEKFNNTKCYRFRPLSVVFTVFPSGHLGLVGSAWLYRLRIPKFCVNPMGATVLLNVYMVSPCPLYFISMLIVVLLPVEMLRLYRETTESTEGQICWYWLPFLELTDANWHPPVWHYLETLLKEASG